MNFFKTLLSPRKGVSIIASLAVAALSFAAEAVEYTYGGVVYDVNTDANEAFALRYDGKSQTIKIVDNITSQGALCAVYYQDGSIFENNNSILTVDASEAQELPMEIKFSGCEFLNTFIPPKEWNTVSSYQFYDCPRLNLATVLTPSVTSVGEYAFAMSKSEYIGELHGVNISAISHKSCMENRIYSVIDLKNDDEELKNVYDSNIDCLSLEGVTCLMLDGYDMTNWFYTVSMPELLSLAVSNGTVSIDPSNMPSKLQYITLSGKIQNLSVVEDVSVYEIDGENVEVVENFECGGLKSEALDLKGKVRNLVLTRMKNLKSLTGCEGVVMADITDCRNLEAIILPDVEEFVSGADNTNLKEVYLGDKLKVMHQSWTFDDCNGIEDFIFGGSIEEWLAVKRLYAEAESPTEAPLSKVTNFWYGHGYAKIDKLTELNASNIGNATEIGPEAFAAYKGLTKIDLPASVKVIGPSSFAVCTGLKSIKINAETISQYAFYGVTGAEDFTIGNKLAYIGPAFSKTDNPVTTVNYLGDASSWASIERSLTVYLDPYDPEGGVGNICRGTYLIPTKEMLFGGKPLETLVLDNPERIGAGAFANNKALTSVKLICKNYFPEFGERAFYGCNSLKSFVVESAAGSRAGNDEGFVIGKEAFAYCSALEEIPMLSNLKSIASDALYESGWLKKQEPNSVVYLNTAKGMTAVTYNGKPSESTQLVIKDGTEAINDYAFKYDVIADINSLSLPGTLKYIGTEALNGINFSGELVIPASVDTMKTNSIYDVTRLKFEGSDKPMYFETGIYYYLGSIFYGREFTEESGRVVMYGSGSSLKRVEYGEKVKKVDYNIGVPFMCDDVQEIYSYSKIPPVYIGTGANVETCTLYVPGESVEAYRAAEGWKEFKTILPIESSGIDSVESDSDEAERHYDTNGRIVEPSQKGIHIVVGKNGKVRKVLVK